MRRRWPLCAVALLSLAVAAGTELSAQDTEPAGAKAADAGAAAAPPAPARAADPTRRDLDSYRLGVDDEVEVSVYKPGGLDTSVVRKLVVPANGEVSYPPIGKINLLGKTAFEVEAIIGQRFKEENILTNPNVGCIVTRYAPRTVSVIGAVRASVELPIHRNLRILELLSKIGGLEAPGADFSQVEIRRVGNDGRPFRFTINVDAAFNQNDEQQNVVVMEGDIVKVPQFESATPQSSDFVYVLGKVNQRGRIPMVKGRTPFTLVKLIAICGDFQDFADRSSVKVIRATETGRKWETIDFDDIIEGKRPDFELKPDDVIFVPETFL